LNNIEGLPVYEIIACVWHITVDDKENSAQLFVWKNSGTVMWWQHRLSMN